MISNKHITKIAALLISVTLVLCFLAMNYSDKLTGEHSSSEYEQEYETKLFNTDEVMNVNILMDEQEWQNMLDNAISEQYYRCDVEINGTTFYGVGIRPKGNTSLSSIANDPDNNRYSFKLEFDQFVDGQTCFGLDKLILNNSYADTTNMKETIIYDMYQYLDADASLYNYAKISVNGEYWGVYLALEAIEESFMLRNYSAQKGYLYKPDGMNMGGRNNADGDRGENMQRPENGMEIPGKMQNGRRSGRSGGMGSDGGGNLNYTDDDLDSYATIWEGAVNASSDADHKRVVTALKNISAGTDLETYLDVDNVLKYMAVHSFSVNEDSLSGSMAHNYYLYESGGKLNILPWDYNLAFGGMHSSSGSDVVNDPIDEPYDSTQFFNALLENAEYKARYHEYYNKLIEEYIFGGKFDETYKQIRSRIDSLVENDPTSMYTYDEYIAGAQMLYDTVMLRAESIRGQLEGTIPSTADGQREDPSGLIDASAIDVSVMGKFMGGGPGGGRGGNPFGENREEAVSQDNMQPPVEKTDQQNVSQTQENDKADVKQREQEELRPSASGDTERPAPPSMEKDTASDKNHTAENLQEESIGNGNMNESFPGDGRGFGQNRQPPEGMHMPQEQNIQSSEKSIYIACAATAAIIFGILFAIFYKKRKF